jgi:hypothetical protein
LSLNQILPLILVGAGVGGFLFLTEPGKQLWAQLTGGFDTYDPKKTDLFPFATGLENARNEAKDFVADILDPKNEASIKGFQPFDASKVKVPANYKGLFGR